MWGFPVLTLARRSRAIVAVLVRWAFAATPAHSWCSASRGPRPRRLAVTRAPTGSLPSLPQPGRPDRAVRRPSGAATVIGGVPVPAAPAAPSAPDLGPKIARALVVANETVRAEALLTELRRLHPESDAQFFVCAPANPVHSGQAELRAPEPPSPPPSTAWRPPWRSCGRRPRGRRHRRRLPPDARHGPRGRRLPPRPDRHLHPPGGALRLAAPRPRRAGPPHVPGARPARHLAGPGRDLRQPEPTAAAHRRRLGPT